MPSSSQQVELHSLGAQGQRELVDAFVGAWERADVAGLVDLLVEDARFRMPPLPAWFSEREDISCFLSERMFVTPWRLLRIGTNAQLAFACYQGLAENFRLGAINVVRLQQWAPLYPRMTRIFIRPEWVGVLDFETRAPSAVEHPASRLSSQAKDLFAQVQCWGSSIGPVAREALLINVPINLDLINTWSAGQLTEVRDRWEQAHAFLTGCLYWLLPASWWR